MKAPDIDRPPAAPAAAPRLLRIDEVARRLGCSKRQIYNLIRERGFPKPIRYTPGFVVWPEPVVDDWIRAVTAAPTLN